MTRGSFAHFGDFSRKPRGSGSLVSRVSGSTRSDVTQMAVAQNSRARVTRF